MGGYHALSGNPNSNTTTPEGVDIDENCAPSGMNNAARETLAIIRDMADDLGGKAVSSGTDTVTLTTESTVTAYYDGLELGFIAGGTNTGAATLNVDGVGAKAIRKANDQTLAAGDILAGMPVKVFYDASANSAAGAFLLLNPAGTTIDGLLEDLDTLGASSADGEIIVATGAGTLAWESGATARTSLGLAIGTDVAAYAATASQAEAEAGTSTAIRRWTPERIAQAIAALASSGGYPPGHLFGLTLSNAADADHDITVAVGSARNEGDTVDLDLAGAITKQIDAAWAVGTNAGGLNTGSVANNTWYEVHLIRRSDTGVVDAMFTTTANRATLPANYDSQRRIGWVRTDGSANIRAFTQVEDYFTLTTQINDGAASASTTASQITLTVPAGAVARFRASAAPGTGAVAIVFSEIVEGNVTPAVSTGIASLVYTEGDGGAQIAPAAGHFELRVNGSSQIEVDASASSGTFDISTYGWIDTRGRLA